MHVTRRLMQEANRHLAENEAKVEILLSQVTDANMLRKAAEKKLRDLEGELDGRKLLYDKLAQLCEDKRYRELIVELQREARNADARKDAAVERMNQMNLELERLKEASSRSAGMKNKEYEMRFESLRVQATEAAKQATILKATPNSCFIPLIIIIIINDYILIIMIMIIVIIMIVIIIIDRRMMLANLCLRVAAHKCARS